MRVKRESGAHLVARSAGIGEALVKEEGASGEAREPVAVGEAIAEHAEVVGATVTLEAREGDVGMVGPSFGDEAACGCGGDDFLLKGAQRWGDDDVGEEDTSAIEEIEPAEFDWNGRRLDCVEARGELSELFWRGFAEELQRDVPAFGR